MEEGGLYDEASSINKVNKKYNLLLSTYITEDQIMELERRAFEQI